MGGAEILCIPLGISAVQLTFPDHWRKLSQAVCSCQMTVCRGLGYSGLGISHRNCLQLGYTDRCSMGVLSECRWWFFPTVAIPSVSSVPITDIAGQMHEGINYSLQNQDIMYCIWCLFTTSCDQSWRSLWCILTTLKFSCMFCHGVWVWYIGLVNRSTQECYSTHIINGTSPSCFVTHTHTHTHTHTCTRVCVHVCTCFLMLRYHRSSSACNVMLLV
jgi:hypothetical protein